MTLPVVVLAGSRDGARDPLAILGGVAHKALLPVAGKPMLTRVLAALRSTPALGPIYVSVEAPETIEPLLNGAQTLPTAQGPSGSVAYAIGAIGTPLLVTTADHPLLRPEWIEAFVSKSQQAHDLGACDLAAGIASQQTIERDVPGTKRTYIRLRDIRFSGCNLFWLGTPRAAAVVTLWQKLERERKRPWRMAAVLGPGILLRAITGTLTRDALYQRLFHLTGAHVRLIEIDDGRAAVDVDKASDLILVEKLLASA